MVAVHSVLFLALLGFTGHSASEVDSGQVIQGHYSINSESQFDVKESFLQNLNNGNKRILQLDEGKNGNSFTQETEETQEESYLQMRKLIVEKVLINAGIVDQSEAEEAVQALKENHRLDLVYQLRAIGIKKRKQSHFTPKQQALLSKVKKALEPWKRQKMQEQEHREKPPSPMGEEGQRILKRYRQFKRLPDKNE